MSTTKKQQTGPEHQLEVRDSENTFRSTNHGGGTAVDSSLSTVSTVTYGSGPYYRTVITLTDFVWSHVDGTTNGGGDGISVFTFPAGDIHILGGQQEIDSVVSETDASMVLDIGVGSVAADSSQETLSSTKEDIINKDDITLSSNAGAGVINESTGGVITGNSTAGNPAQAYFNVACTAATSTANQDITVSGELSFIWANLGDY